jgi:hypothetical protein
MGKVTEFQNGFSRLLIAERCKVNLQELVGFKPLAYWCTSCFLQLDALPMDSRGPWKSSLES